ncbi:MAG: hypothetical protein V3U11_12770, partial [Planctomycetota bacterium]
QTFADNRAATPTTVFSGSVQVPKSGQKTSSVKLQFQKPFVYDRSRGHLLVEVFEKTTALSTSVGMEISYTRPLSDVSRRGKGGTLTGFGSPFSFWDYGVYVNSKTGGLELLLDVPAKTNTFFLLGKPTSPQSLQRFGAAGNNLYVQALAMLPHNSRRPFCGKYHYDLRLPVPPDPRLQGLSISAQAVAQDLAANQLGLVFSDAVDIRIGPVHRSSARLVLGTASATAGRMVPRSFGALSMQLEIVAEQLGSHGHTTVSAIGVSGSKR